MTQQKGNARKTGKRKKTATPSEIAKANADNTQTAAGVRDDAPDRNATELTASQITTAEVHNAGLKIFKVDSQAPAEPDTIYLKAKDEDDAYTELRKHYGDDFPRHLAKFTQVDALPDDEVLANDFSNVVESAGDI